MDRTSSASILAEPLCSTAVVHRPVWSKIYMATASDAVQLFRTNRQPLGSLSTENLFISKHFGLVVKTKCQIRNLLSFINHDPWRRTVETMKHRTPCAHVGLVVHILNGISASLNKVWDAHQLLRGLAPECHSIRLASLTKTESLKMKV